LGIYIGSFSEPPKRFRTGIWKLSTLGLGLADTVIYSISFYMMVLQLLFVHFLMPETKGISLEELSKKLSNKKEKQ